MSLSCSGYLDFQRNMLCDEDCEDYFKHCVIRVQLQSEYCYYKKRKQKKLEKEAKK